MHKPNYPKRRDFGMWVIGFFILFSMACIVAIAIIVAIPPEEEIGRIYEGKLVKVEPIEFTSWHKAFIERAYTTKKDSIADAIITSSMAESLILGEKIYFINTQVKTPDLGGAYTGIRLIVSQEEVNQMLSTHKWEIVSLEE